MKLDPVTDEQTEIADKLIGRNTDRITEELTLHRALTDELFKKRDPELDPNGTKALLQEYPIGCCLYIREAVIAIVRSSALEEQDIPKAQKSILTQIVETLGVKRVWGVKDDQYFHNGIQAGNYFLDIANDTVDATQPKVVVSTIEQAGFRDIKSIQDYLDISTRYHKFNFERNTAIPELAPLFPLIQIKTDKGIQRKKIHSITLPVIADSLLRSGLDEFKKAYSAAPKTDKITEQGIAESVRLLNHLLGAQQLSPYPSPGNGLPTWNSFSTVSQALSSPEIDPKILYRLYNTVKTINTVSRDIMAT